MAPTLKVKPCEAFSKIYFKHNCCVKLSIQLRNLPAYFFLRIVWYPGSVYSSKMVHKGKCNVKSRLHIIRILNQNRYFTAGLFLIISYHYPSKTSEVLSFATGPLIELLSLEGAWGTFIAYSLLIQIILSFPKVRSTRLCSQALLLSYP
jgi:hypothetical protein